MILVASQPGSRGISLLQKLIGLALLPISFAFATSGSAATLSVVAHVTADNHYGLYVGNERGSDLRFVGRNEVGSLGNPGVFNWVLAETWEFSAHGGEYLYVVAWDDEDQQMWIGDFITSGPRTIVSDISSWLYVVPDSGQALQRNASIPVTPSDLAPIIETAQWQSPAEQFSNGVGPWLTIEGIDPSAQFIWHDTLYGNSSSDGRFVVYRSADPLPEPRSLALMGTVLLAAAVNRRRSGRRCPKNRG